LRLKPQGAPKFVRMLLRHPLNQAVHTCHEPPRQSAVSCSRVCPVFQFLKIKDLTCNAQFNFCLLTSTPGLPENASVFLYDRSELARSAPLRLAPALAESCGKLQNQTFKDHFWCSSHFYLPGDKKTRISAPTIQTSRKKLRSSHALFENVGTRSGHDLKSQKLEEPCPP
jgi:hypothetical protein